MSRRDRLAAATLVLFGSVVVGLVIWLLVDAVLG